MKFYWVALAWAAVGVAQAAEVDKWAKSTEITIEQADKLATALRNLDGHLVIVKQTGTEGTVMVPWEFGDGRLRLRIANNLAIVDARLKTANAAQAAIFKEVTKKFGVEDLKVGTPERAEYDRQYSDLMKSTAAKMSELSRIKASELKLDRNEIAVTVLQALGPILEDDISK